MKRRIFYNIFAKNIIFIKNFRGNSIKVEGAKELAQGLKALINLNSVEINLWQKRDPLRIHHKTNEKNKTKNFLIICLLNKYFIKNKIQ